MRRVVTLFEVRGSNDIRARLGEMRSGFAQNRQEMDMWGKSSSYVNNQLRALGTTLRYAFAGTAIFGTLALVKNLGDFQAKLGEIQSIATGPNGLPLLDRQIDDLGNRLINVSNETTQPIADLQSGVLSLYSTIGNVPQDEAADLMKTIAETSIVAQSNIEDTTQALLGMIDAFGRGTKEIPKFGDEFYRVIQLSAGMSGHIYAQQLGRLSASATLSGFSPEQMGALAVGATRFGGSPATNMRGLAQLMTFVMNPTAGKTEKAFQGLGLGRNERNKLGGYAVLQRVLSAVNKAGLKGNPRGLTDDVVAQLDENYPNGAPNSALGLSGEGGNLLAKLFPRIEGRRIAAVLARLQTPDQVRGTPNKTLAQYLQQVSHGTETVDKAMARAMDYRRINQAANAMHNFGIEIGTALSPLLQYPARGITGLASSFNRQKWGVGPVSGQQIEIGGAAVGLAVLLRTLQRGPGSLVRGAGAAGAVTDLLSGDTQRGHSPANPLYVAVVYSLSGPGGAGFRRGVPTGGGGVPGGAAESEITKSGRLARFGRAGLRAAKYTPWVWAPLAAYEVSDALFGDGGATANRRARAAKSSHPLLRWLSQDRSLIGNAAAAGAPITDWRNLTPAEKKVLDMFDAGKISSASAERRLHAVTTREHFKASGAQPFAVKGKVDVTIHDDRTKKKVHVTTDLYQDFTAPAPQVKGKDKTYRGGQ